MKEFKRAGDDNLQSQINQKANSSDVYTRTEVASQLNGKADKSTTYTKTEVDSALASKANSADVYGKNEVYTKSETDTALSGKADTATTLAGYGITDAYTKSETDTAISTAIAGIDLSAYALTAYFLKEFKRNEARVSVNESDIILRLIDELHHQHDAHQKEVDRLLTIIENLTEKLK